MAPTGPAPTSVDKNCGTTEVSRIIQEEISGAASSGGRLAQDPPSDDGICDKNDERDLFASINGATADANTGSSIEDDNHDRPIVSLSPLPSLPGAVSESATSVNSTLKAKASVYSILQASEEAVQSKIESQNSMVDTRPVSYESQDSKRVATTFSYAGQSLDSSVLSVHSMYGGCITDNEENNTIDGTSPVTRGTLSDFEEIVLAKANAPYHVMGPEASNDVRVTIRRMPRDLQDFQDNVLEKVRSSNVNGDVSAMMFDAETNDRDDLLLTDLRLCDETMDKSNLAVAVAVENEDNLVLPSVVEFDPDAKPPVYRNRRFRLYAALAIVVATAGTVGALTGMLLVSKNMSPQPVPLPDRATMGIREYVERLVGPSEPLDDPRNPYRKALEWIQDVDPMALTPQSKKFTQRFLAAYFYYATTTFKEWSNKCIPSEKKRINNNCNYQYIGVKKTTLIYDAPSAKRWLSSDDECLWAGVACDASGQIVKLDFSGSSMTGSFPDGIAALPFLQYVSLSHGELEGKLPAIAGSMKHLMNLELAGNRFTGSIPDHWYHSKSLIRLNVGKNNLTGSVSNTIGQWSKIMSHLLMYENAFTGSLPREMGGLTMLKNLALSGNLFVGSLPTGVASDCRHLHTLELQRNKLSGSIPSEFGQLTELQYSFLQSNLFNGTLPSGLSNLSLLWEFDLSNNQFSGSIESLVNFTRILKLRIENNRLTGSIPTEMGRLTYMNEFTASGNKFNGTVPQALCNRVPSKYRPGSEQFLGKFQLDCAASDESGAPEINCTCCTQCCDSDGTDCLPVV